ncbi:MAG: hypothetical protein ACR2PH_10595, partial [Desulfobulbia bacterium]
MKTMNWSSIIQVFNLIQVARATACKLPLEEKIAEPEKPFRPSMLRGQPITTHCCPTSTGSMILPENRPETGGSEDGGPKKSVKAI